ncbi:VWA domain-containing protein [Pontimicrobium sp. IMCC45349]|uniref:VWA domain-containing protein n=1 Tax=Pontimicrobium sp. IMCC45349 TaxID=3391574 RepID=UPI0039A12033
MSTTTLLYIIIAGITALSLALFQYLYKSKKNKLHILFSFLRFITLFSLFLLIINPKFEKITIYNEKPKLVVAVDNSESIKHIGKEEDANNLVNNVVTNQELNDKFNIERYVFGGNIEDFDSLSFNAIQSNISKALSSLDNIYKNVNAPIVLLTDGNQTIGTDYEYVSNKLKQSVYPIVLGDTTQFVDIKIQQLNANKYAYLKNKFPVEVIVTYSGNQEISSQLTISTSNSTKFSKQLNLSKQNNSQTVIANLLADKVGVTTYYVSLSHLSEEKNTANNVKPFAVEVIDQKTNVAIISDIIHPDLGAIKKMVETNQQRSVSIVSPSEYLNSKELYQLAIIYQPNNKFKSVFDYINNEGLNSFVIVGTNTQWSFLNSAQTYYSQEITLQTEDYQPSLNSNYNTFIVDDLGFQSFPPLNSEFGDVIFNIPNSPILYKSINGNITDKALLTTFEDNNKRGALLLGENIWKWRAQSYLIDGTFDKFDSFFGKLIQYLTSNKRKSRLNLDYESFYNGSQDVVIIAQYFNKNYEFDANASLSITVNNTETNNTITIPFVLKQNKYQVDLSQLAAGTYDFTVNANNEISQSGRIQILDFNIEQQFFNANSNKLKQLAKNTNANSYHYTKIDAFVSDILSDGRYSIIEKSNKKIVPLIDFKYLLALIALSLALEWFIRKYNGLI